jgi:hypothetical protein
MSSDEAAQSREQREPLYIYDDRMRLTEGFEVELSDGLAITTYTHSVPTPKAVFEFAHDTAKGLFVLTYHDGSVERFRDKPARQLMVEPDPITGELRPVIRSGHPTYVYLCREEREVL